MFSKPTTLCPLCVMKSLWISFLSVYLNTWKSLFSAVLKISLFILFFESVMVMNRNWSLVYSVTEFFPPKLYSLLPIFNLLSIHKRTFPPVLCQPVCLWPPVMPMLMTPFVQAHAERATSDFLLHSDPEMWRRRELSIQRLSAHNTEMSWAAGSQGWSSVPQLHLSTDWCLVIPSQSCTILHYTN